MEGFYEYRSEAKFNSPKSLGFRMKDVKDATSQKLHAFWGKVQHLTPSTFLPRRQPLVRLQPNERMIGHDTSRTWWSMDIITIAIRKESPFSSVFFPCTVLPLFYRFTIEMWGDDPTWFLPQWVTNWSCQWCVVWNCRRSWSHRNDLDCPEVWSGLPVGYDLTKLLYHVLSIYVFLFI